MSQGRSSAVLRHDTGVCDVPAMIVLPAVLAFFLAANLAVPGVACSSSAAFTVDERVESQRRIEEVYRRNRVWPSQDAEPGPALAEVLPLAALRAKVEAILSEERLLADCWGVAIGAHEVQAELERMARSSKAPSRLCQPFAALDGDPTVIALCLVRPLLVDREIRAFVPR